jgi:hypothetical protein
MRGQLKQTVRKLRMSGFLVDKTDVRIMNGSHFGIRDQLLLLPEAVDDYMDAENPVRFRSPLEAFVKLMRSCSDPRHRPAS